MAAKRSRRRRRRQGSVNSDDVSDDDNNVDNSNDDVEASSDNERSATACSHMANNVHVAQVRKAIKTTNSSDTCKACQSNKKSNDDELKNNDYDNEDNVSSCLMCGHVYCGRHSRIHGQVPRSGPPHVVYLNHNNPELINCHECELDLSVTRAPSKAKEACGLLRRHYNSPSLNRGKREELVKSNNVDGNASVTKSVKSNNDVVIVTNGIDVSDKLLSLNVNSCVERKPRGLVNLGNTCFFNSVLQCLSQLRPLQRALHHHNGSKAKFTLPRLDGVHEKSTTTVKLSEDMGEVTRTLMLLLDQMNDCSRTQSVVNPSSLLGSVARRNAQFRGFAQQDAHEFLRSMMDEVKSEETRRQKRAVLNHFGLDQKKKTQQVDEELRHKLKTIGKLIGHTLVDHVLGGYFVATIRCDTCGHASQTYELFLDVSLSLNEPRELNHVDKSQKNDHQDIDNDDVQTDKRADPIKQRKKEREQKKKEKKKGGKRNNNKSDSTKHKEVLEVEQSIKHEDNTASVDDDNNQLNGECNSHVIEDPDVDKKFVNNIENHNDREEVIEEGERDQCLNHNDVMPSKECLNQGQTTNGTLRESYSVQEESSLVDGDLSKLTTQPHATDITVSESQLKSSCDEFTSNEICNSRNDLGEDTMLNGEANGDTESSKESKMAMMTNGGYEESTSKKRLTDRFIRSEWINLSLKPLKEPPSISSSSLNILTCLSRFVRAEHLRGANRWLCDYCSGNIDDKDDDDDEYDVEDDSDLDSEVSSSSTSCSSTSSSSKPSKVFRDATRQVLIYNPPWILTLQLKRFEHHYGQRPRKISKAIQFPLLLDLAPYCAQTSKLAFEKVRQEMLYTLVGVVEHMGDLNSGHYTAYVKVSGNDINDEEENPMDFASEAVAREGPSLSRMRRFIMQHMNSEKKCNKSGNSDNMGGKWYHVSDSHVSAEVSVARVLKASAFLLFYQRIR